MNEQESKTFLIVTDHSHTHTQTSYRVKWWQHRMVKWNSAEWNSKRNDLSTQAELKFADVFTLVFAFSNNGNGWQISMRFRYNLDVSLYYELTAHFHYKHYSTPGYIRNVSTFILFSFSITYNFPSHRRQRRQLLCSPIHIIKSKKHILHGIQTNRAQ